MRRAKVLVHGIPAGILEEWVPGKSYYFYYLPDYEGPPVSLTMPILKREYNFDQFPPFFEGLLPEGYQLDSLLRKMKIDRNDFFGQLLIVGGDMVGAVTVEEAP
jgi:serine/threonine-protein kinase HipA